MDNKPETVMESTATLAEVAPHNVASVQFDVAIKEFADLSTKANGVSITHIDVPSDLKGLPSQVPVAIIRGESPDIEDISDHLERYRLHPARKDGIAMVQTLDSFIKLTKRHSTEHSAIFANMNWKEPHLTTVVDYHPEVKAYEEIIADNCKHRVHYAFPLSEEWQQWVEMNGKTMSQSDFALWVEDRIADLASSDEDEKNLYEEMFQATIATPAEILDLSRGLQVNVSSRVKNSKILQSGEGQIVYEEDHDTKDSSGGSIKVPGMFILSIPPFFMGEPIRIPVRLRYRVHAGQITWFYQLYRPDIVINNAIMADIETVENALDLPVYQGKPEA